MTHTAAQGGEGKATATFHSLAVAPAILDTLDKLGLTTPTPIQAQAIPAGLEGRDVIGIAQTGTGKTLAFGIPMIQRLIATGGYGLVLVPTRELALQVDETLKKIAQPAGLKTLILMGGVGMNPQIDGIMRNPNIIIATPGRLIDHLERGTIVLSSVESLVLDEADRMLDMGFWPQVRRIIKDITTDRQTSLFSATLSREITDLAAAHMRTPVRIEVAPQGTTAERVAQEFYFARKEEKARLLEKILGERAGSTIVFIRTKHGAKKLTRLVQQMGHTAAEIHGNRSLNQRTEALNGFKTGKYRVLVATDIAARGIDVKGIDLVINYDMPTATEDYVNRIGRTERAGASGTAITFAEPHERNELRQIERLIQKPITISDVQGDLPPMRAGAVSGGSTFHRQTRTGGSHGQSHYGRDRGASRDRRGPRPASRGRSGGRGNW